jgi:hypothetical protein
VQFLWYFHLTACVYYYVSDGIEQLSTDWTPGERVIHENWSLLLKYLYSFYFAVAITTGKSPRWPGCSLPSLPRKRARRTMPSASQGCYCAPMPLP